ncbi:MAG TPA: subclass B1 metallo-beta-lactamase [Bacillota bacterium]|nr:subclass B1 metallo-beta-lactamase [Bacillota bacterium]
MKMIAKLFFVALIITVFSFHVFAVSSTSVDLTKINDQIWVHTDYVEYPGGFEPNNGLVVITKKGLVLIDTCTNHEKSRKLIKLAEAKFKKRFIMAIITHAHGDKIAGIEALFEAGITEVVSTKLTAAQAVENGFQQPLPKLDVPTTNFEIGGMKWETFYPGEGHAPDNITVWFPDRKILYVGCLVRPLSKKDLGSTTNANLKEWPNSLHKLLVKYPDMTLVIPTHGDWGDSSLIHHTLSLLNQ